MGKQMGGGDWEMGRGKRAYETDGEGGTRKGESIRNVNKEYRKKEYIFGSRLWMFMGAGTSFCSALGRDSQPLMGEVS